LLSSPPLWYALRARSVLSRGLPMKKPSFGPWSFLYPWFKASQVGHDFQPGAK
jgi:hypothetical protein